MQPFTDKSSSNVKSYFAQNWDAGFENTCKVVDYQNQFSVWRINDYKRCVCFWWDVDDPDCLKGKASAETIKADDIIEIN